MKAMVTVGFFDHERISEEGTSDKFSLTCESGCGTLLAVWVMSSARSG